MMMIPRKRNEFDLFSSMFDVPFFEKKEKNWMKTDIKEVGNNYVIEVDLPGYDKNNIQIEMENGYLNVTAKVDTSNEDSEEEGKYIHKERYYGECSRSFYVGDNVSEEDIKATFKNGILTLTLPKEEQKKLENKKFIPID